MKIKTRKTNIVLLSGIIILGLLKDISFGTVRANEVKKMERPVVNLVSVETMMKNGLSEFVGNTLNKLALNKKNSDGTWSDALGAMKPYAWRSMPLRTVYFGGSKYFVVNADASNRLNEETGEVDNSGERVITLAAARGYKNVKFGYSEYENNLEKYGEDYFIKYENSLLRDYLEGNVRSTILGSHDVTGSLQEDFFRNRELEWNSIVEKKIYTKNPNEDNNVTSADDTYDSQATVGKFYALGGNLVDSEHVSAGTYEQEDEFKVNKYFYDKVEYPMFRSSYYDGSDWCVPLISSTYGSAEYGFEGAVAPACNLKLSSVVFADGGNVELTLLDDGKSNTGLPDDLEVNLIMSGHNIEFEITNGALKDDQYLALVYRKNSDPIEYVMATDKRYCDVSQIFSEVVEKNNDMTVLVCKDGKGDAFAEGLLSDEESSYNVCYARGVSATAVIVDDDDEIYEEEESSSEDLDEIFEQEDETDLKVALCEEPERPSEETTDQELMENDEINNEEFMSDEKNETVCGKQKISDNKILETSSPTLPSTGECNVEVMVFGFLITVSAALTLSVAVQPSVHRVVSKKRKYNK